MHLAACECSLALFDTAIAWPTLVLNPIPNHHYERGQPVSRTITDRKVVHNASFPILWSLPESRISNSPQVGLSNALDPVWGTSLPSLAILSMDAVESLLRTAPSLATNINVGGCSSVQAKES